MKVNKTVFTKTVVVIGAAAFLCWSVPASAAVILSIQPSGAAPGATGSFDVLLTNTGTSAVNIAGFNFQLSTPNSNVTFTDVTTATTVASYIFPNSLFGPDITTTASAQTVEAGDVDATGNGTNVAPGATFGLGDVFFNVSPTASVGTTAMVSFAPFPDTSLSNLNGDNVTFTTTSGTITVEPEIVATPEPSSAWLTGFFICALPSLARLRARNRS